MTDPIADMLTRIRNAVTAKQTRVDMPSSRIKAEIARILQDEGYIQGFKLLDEVVATTTAPVKTLRLFLEIRAARREADYRASSGSAARPPRLLRQARTCRKCWRGWARASSRRRAA
mgnify:CR=1 FL=1